MCRTAGRCTRRRAHRIRVRRARLRAAGTVLLCGVAVGCLLERRVDEHLAVHDQRSPRAGTSGGGDRRRRRRCLRVRCAAWTVSPSRSASVMIDGGVARPAGEVLAQGLLSGHRGRVVDEDFVEGDALGIQRGRERGAGEQAGERARPRPCVGLCRRVPRSCARSPCFPGIGLPCPQASGAPASRRLRPRRTSTAGRKVRELSTAQTMPMAPTGPRARLFVRSLRSSAIRPRATVAALATIGPADCRSAARMEGHWSQCRASSCGTGGEQQGVVGGRSDDQDGQDALDLPVDADDVAVGECVDHCARQGEREDRADDDHQRQEHAAVDEQQNDQHGRPGRRPAADHRSRRTRRTDRPGLPRARPACTAVPGTSSTLLP